MVAHSAGPPVAVPRAGCQNGARAQGFAALRKRTLAHCAPFRRMKGATGGSGGMGFGQALSSTFEMRQNINYQGGPNQSIEVGQT